MAIGVNGHKARDFEAQDEADVTERDLGPTGPNAAAGKAELFDLSKDPNKKTDLAARMPEKVEALKRKLAVVAKADRDAVVKE